MTVDRRQELLDEVIRVTHRQREEIAVLLAALEESDRCNYYELSVSVPGKFAKASIAPMPDYRGFWGRTRQEAMCRAFVAWKQAIP